MSEIWKTIKNFPRYSVSNQGRVRNNSTGKILKYRTKEYFQVVLSQGKSSTRKDCQVHRLVAETFIPNPKGLPMVNHIDGNRFNNNVNNLEWVTNRENIVHAYRTLNRQMGFKRHKPSKKVIRVEDGKVFDSITDAARFCGFKNPNSISKHLKGVYQSACGYHWQEVV